MNKKPEKKASFKRLTLSKFKLDSLLKITEAINDNLSTKELLKEYEGILKKDLNIGKIVIFSYNKSWSNVLNCGVETDIINQIDVEKELLAYKDISTSYSLSKDSLLKTFDIIIPVFKEKSALAYVLIGDIEEEKGGLSPTIKHLRFIQTLTNIIIVAVENKRLHDENLKQEVLKRELELSSNMQNILIPDEDILPKNDKIYVTGFYFPHFEVGGDYYDVIELNENELGFCIADVSGKGFSAALLMSNFQANLKALFTEDISLENLILKLNKIVLKNANNEKFITFFVGRYNFKTRKLTYINSAHTPPLLYDTKTNKIIYLTKGCVGLGMLDEIPFLNRGEITINPKSKLFCYTDGLSEIENDKHEEIGLEYVKKSMEKQESIAEIIEKMITKLNINKDNNQIFDDVTALGLEFF